MKPGHTNNMGLKLIGDFPTFDAPLAQDSVLNNMWESIQIYLHLPCPIPPSSPPHLPSLLGTPGWAGNINTSTERYTCHQMYLSYL